ncbi:MAG TPA: sigma factor [Bacteroidota bacterium]|nr:sigma factor [Bacteroidota bacterium]
MLLNEREVMQGVSDGDDASLAQLYDLYGQTVYNLVYYITHSIEEAETLTQDVFLTVWQKASSIDLQNGTMEDWIFNKAKEVAIIRSKSNLQTMVINQKLNGNVQTFIEKETKRITELSSVNPVSLKNVLLSPEVKENIFFTIHVARIAEGETQTLRKNGSQTSTNQNNGVLWFHKKIGWYVIGKILAAIAFIIFIALFIDVLFMKIDHQGEVISQQYNRNVRLEHEIDEKQNVVDFFQARRLSMIFLAGLSADSMVSGKIFWDPDRKIALLQFLNLRATSPNEHYQLWVIRNSFVTNVCEFEITQPGKSFCKILPLDLLAPPKVSVIELRVEPRDGISKPNGEAVLSAVLPHVIIFG